MNLDSVITQLKTYVPQLGGRVGGAADFDIGVESVIAITDPVTGKLAYPAAVVMPLEDDSPPTADLTGLYQTVTETIGVVVEFDATADRRGQGGVSQVEAMKYAIFGALLNWHIDPARGSRGLYYAGGSLLTFDRARLFWEFRFSFDAIITDADGFPEYGDPLVDILTTGTLGEPANVVQPIIIDTKV